MAATSKQHTQRPPPSPSSSSLLSPSSPSSPFFLSLLPPLPSSSPPSQELILDTLHWCFQVETSQGLRCKTIPLCTGILNHESPCLRARAARVIYDLTVPSEGKEVCVREEGCVETLVRLLMDGDAFVRSQAAAALMR